MYQNIAIERPQQTPQGYWTKGWAHIWDDEDGYIKRPLKDYRYGYKKDPKGKSYTLDGKAVKQVRRWSDEELKKGQIYESDVQLETRVLIDEYGHSDEPSINHREFYFDIETEILQGFPNSRNPMNKITSIAYWLKSENEYGVLILDPERLVKSSIKDNVQIISCLTEQELLQTFMEAYKNYDPTILTGWNIEFFDIPYLYARMARVCGHDVANALSRINIVKEANAWSKMAGQDKELKYNILGVEVLDYLALYKKFTINERSSYRLDVIGRIEVDLGKIEYDGTLDDLFRTDIDKFIEYTLNDVEIVKRLDEKLKYIDLARAICHKGHVPYEKIYVQSQILEGAILTYLRTINVVAPNKNFDNQKDAKYSGAYVMDPKPGRYEWVYDLDLTSLYPSLIMSLNISPDTKISTIHDFDLQTFLKNEDRPWEGQVKNKYAKFKYTQWETTGHLRSWLEENRYSIAANGAVYNTRKKGLIPAILEKWFEDRMTFKNLMKKHAQAGDDDKREYFHQRQWVTKILLNSMYGVLGSPTFRWFDLDNAEAITLSGQQLIKNTAKIVDHYYNRELGEKTEHCIYTDTDSVFFSALPLVKHRYPDIDTDDDVIMTEKILGIAEEVQNHINDTYTPYAKKFHNLDTHKFDIKQETVAKSGIWIAKKRYAQWIINSEGVVVNKLDVKGIDVVRSNYPAAFKKFLGEILMDILQKVPKDTIDNKIYEFRLAIPSYPIVEIAKSTGVKNIRKYLPASGTYKPFNTSFKGVPAHVKASINYNDLLSYYNRENAGKINNGDKIKWVYLKDNPLGLESCAFKGYDDPQEIEDFIEKFANYDKIFNGELKNKLEAFYIAMKWGNLPEKNIKIIRKFFEF